MCVGGVVFGKADTRTCAGSECNKFIGYAHATRFDPGHSISQSIRLTQFPNPVTLLCMNRRLGGKMTQRMPQIRVAVAAVVAPLAFTGDLARLPPSLRSYGGQVAVSG